MKLVEVVSSNVKAVCYDEVAKTLDVTYLSGAVYRYAGVEQETYDALLAADSKGSFIGRNIKGKYEYSKVTL